MFQYLNFTLFAFSVSLFQLLICPLLLISASRRVVLITLLLVILVLAFKFIYVLTQLLLEVMKLIKQLIDYAQTFLMLVLHFSKLLHLHLLLDRLDGSQGFWTV